MNGTEIVNKVYWERIALSAQLHAFKGMRVVTAVKYNQFNTLAVRKWLVKAKTLDYSN